MTKTKIKPITDRVWVKPTEKKTQLPSGIHLPQAFANSIKGSGRSTAKGTVICVGPDVTTVKKNDVVYFSDFTGMEINYEESLVLVMKEDEIMAVDLG